MIDRTENVPIVIRSSLTSCEELERSGVDPEVVEFLAANAGNQFCLTAVIRDGERLSIAVDQEWIEFALEAAAVSDDLLDGVTVPRSVIRAVVGGWTDDWREGGVFMTRADTDGVPHLLPSAAGLT